MENVEQIAHDVILDLLRQRAAEIATLDNGHKLTADLGLRSLDLAQIVAMLEMRTGVDPFAETVAITSIRTVGDLVDAYRRCLAGGGEPGEPASFEQSVERAETRRSASRKRQTLRQMQ